jgi:hypothetical protein
MKTWVIELLESLRRAGLVFRDEVGFEADEEKGLYEVTLRLAAPIPDAGWKPLVAYARGRADEAGYRSRVHYLKRAGRLTILLSKAASRAA